MVPAELRFVPQVKSDIIIARRNVSLAPVEAAVTYTRDGTNTITFNIQGHKELSQLLDSKSVYFTWQCRFANGYPVEDVAMLIEEVIISSNGRTLERIRNAQYIQHFLRGYGKSRKMKAKLGKREGFQQYEDRTVQFHTDAANDAYGFRKAPTITCAPVAAANAANIAAFAQGAFGYEDQIDSVATWSEYTRMSDNLGYMQKQVRRQPRHTAIIGVAHGGGGLLVGANANSNYHLMKFRLPCSGLLASDKMLPIGWMPLTIQLRLSDRARATDNSVVGNFDYEISRPRMHMNVCTVGQAYASAMQQRLRGPGITLNVKMFDTFFQIIQGDRQIVIPSNKQRLSKVWVMFHPNANAGSHSLSAYRSSVSGTNCFRGLEGTNPRVQATASQEGRHCLQSYQFQVGTEVSEAVTLENMSGNLQKEDGNINTGIKFLEAYLRAIGAVNGEASDVEFWGKQLDPLKCNKWDGGDLLQTFLSKYFCCVYDGEKLLGSAIETGVDTESGKDIVVDLRWSRSNAHAAVAAAGIVQATDAVFPQGRSTRVMALIQYHAQIVIKENSVDLSF